VSDSLFPESHSVAIEIGEPGKLTHAGDIATRDQRLAAQFLRFLERCINVVHRDVDSDIRLVFGCGDVALNTITRSRVDYFCRPL
jgi:hypothetical protein